MAKTKISEWSTTPASNTDIDGINIAEGCAPSGINDAIRDLMAQVRSWQSGASGDPFNGPMNGTIGATTAYSGAFTTLSASGTTTLSGLTASTALALDASKNVVSVANTGSGSNVLATSPTLVTPALGTPSSATLTNATGLPISTGVSGLGTGVATALAVNVGSAGAPVVNGGALGTPSSGTVTNLTGTASININGTVGATTPTTGAFTTLAASSSVTLSGGTANGVTYLNGSKVLTSGSALTFDGTNLKTNNLLSTSNLVVSVDNASNSMYVGGGSFSPAELNLESVSSTNWKVGGTERMRLTSTGLGIGTSSPSTRLHVKSADNTNASVIVENLNNTNGILQFGSASSSYAILGGAYQGQMTYNTGAGTPHIWWVGGSEKMRLDSAGNLGLGVTPSAWSGLAYKAIEVGAAGNALFGGTNDFEISANAYYASGWKYGSTNPATVYVQYNGQHQWKTAPSGTAGNAISFTQAMSLTASGDLLVGTTSASVSANGFKIFPDGSYYAVQSTGTTSSIYNKTSYTSGTEYFFDFRLAATTVGTISANGSTTSYNTSSDYRLKNITGPITTSGAYIDSLNPVEGTWKADGTTFVGLIAHEVQEASRTQVATGTKDGDEMQAMDYSNSELIANLIAEVKSLRQRVATLEAQ